MNAYFDIIKQISWMMFFITLVTIPVMAIYSSSSNLKPYIMFDNFTLGNLGGSSIACGQVPLATQEAGLQLACPTGYIQTGATTSDGQQAIQIGLIPSDALASNYCTVSAIESNSLATCAGMVNVDGFTSMIAAQNGAQNVFLKMYDADGHLNSGLFNDPTSYPAVCNSGSASMMVSVGCILAEDEVANRQFQGLVIGCIFVAVALFVMIYTEFMMRVSANKFVEWDVKTVTAGDYTIEFDIVEEMWEKFVRTQAALKPVGMPMIVHFRNWITKQFETRLSACPDLGFEDEPVERIKVAVVNFAFNNAELINLLKQRGAAISSDQFDKMREVDAKINDLKNQPGEDTNLTRPVSVFMTFQQEEGIKRALVFENDEKKSDPAYAEMYDWLEKCQIEIEQASEPSDIIWENRHFTPEQRFRKAIIVVLTVGFALFISFCVVFNLRSYSNELSSKYPAADCAAFNQNYPNLEPFAAQEYALNELLEAGNRDTQFSGFLSCFCDDQKANGFAKDQTYDVNGK